MIRHKISPQTLVIFPHRLDDLNLLNLAKRKFFLRPLESSLFVIPTKKGDAKRRMSYFKERAVSTSLRGNDFISDHSFINRSIQLNVTNFIVFVKLNLYILDKNL